MRDQNGEERRRHERYELKDRVFITFRPEFDRIGWLTDISKGGVSMEYSTLQEYPALPEKTHVDIFSSPRKFDLSNLPCRLVYDAPADRGKGCIGIIETRRCGLVFNEMSEHHAAQLDELLNRCVAG